MLTRRVALPLAALTALATLPVLAGAAPAGASSAVKPTPASRGRDNGDPEGPRGRNKEEQKDNGDDSGRRSGGLGDLLG